MTSTHRMVVFLCWALVLTVSAAESPKPGREYRKPGTIKMAALLERLAQQANPMANPFLSRERVSGLRQAISANPAMTNSAATMFSLGTELLNAGENEPALRAFESSERISLLSGEYGTNNEINVRLNMSLCHLRMGEMINCLSNHNAESCLLPFRGGGLHLWPDGSRRAIGVLTNLLQKYPDQMAARWLLNVAAMTVGDYPDRIPERWVIPPVAFDFGYDIKPFVDVAGPAGLAVNELSGGSAAEDFDGDGLLDLMITSIGLRDQMRLFRNNGDGTFIEHTELAGLLGLTGGLNMITGDYDNDGFVDVFVLRGAWMREEGKFPNSLLRNNGDGTFEDVTEQARLLAFHPTQTAVWFDFDGDGWLDLFVGNETAPGARSHPCELHRNNRDGTFTEMAGAAGVAVRAFVKGVTCADYNNDGRPDLYLSIKAKPNQLLRNEGAGPDGIWRFTNVAVAAGVTLPLESFPTWFFDYDNDGWEDLFVGGYKITDVGDIAADYLGLPNQGERAKLYRNLGDGTFADVTRPSRLDRVLHAMGSNFGDLDNDGWLDFYLGTGDPDLLTIIPNRMFRNAGGRFFQDVTTSGGFGNLQKGHAVSFADFDNDGDQDVHEDMGGAISSDVYPNLLFLNPGHGHRWIKLKLVGVKANRCAIGARIKMTVRQGDGIRTIHRTVGVGGSFGCNPLRQEIGLGGATVVEAVEILWPGSKTRQTFRGLGLDACYELREDSPEPRLVPLKRFAFQLPAAATATRTHPHSK